MGAIYNKAHHARIPIPKSGERIEMRARARVHTPGGDCLGMERAGWADRWRRGRPVGVHKHPHARGYAYTYARAGRRAGRWGRKQRRGIYYSGFTVITRRGKTTPTGNGDAHVCTRAGCVYPIRAVPRLARGRVRARAHVHASRRRARPVS